MTEVTVEPGTVIAKALPPEPEAPAEEDGEPKDSADEEGEEGTKQAQAVVDAPEVEEIFKLQQTDRQVSSIDAKKWVLELTAWNSCTHFRMYALTWFSFWPSLYVHLCREQRIEFNHTYSHFLLPSATNKLKQSFFDRHLFPIEISRTLKDGRCLDPRFFTTCAFHSPSMLHFCILTRLNTFLPPRISDYVYEKKYHGLAQLEIKKIADEDVTFISIRCPVGPHYDFQTITPEELEALPEVIQSASTLANHVGRSSSWSVGHLPRLSQQRGNLYFLGVPSPLVSR